MTFCLFFEDLNKVFNFNYVIKKVECPILNVYFFYVSHLYVLKGIEFNGIAFNKLLVEY